MNTPITSFRQWWPKISMTWVIQIKSFARQSIYIIDFVLFAEGSARSRSLCRERERNGCLQKHPHPSAAVVNEGRKNIDRSSFLVKFFAITI